MIFSPRTLSLENLSTHSAMRDQLQTGRACFPYWIKPVTHTQWICVRHIQPAGPRGRHQPERPRGFSSQCRPLRSHPGLCRWSGCTGRGAGQVGREPRHNTAAASERLRTETCASLWPCVKSLLPKLARAVFWFLQPNHH